MSCENCESMKLQVGEARRILGVMRMAFCYEECPEAKLGKHDSLCAEASKFLLDGAENRDGVTPPEPEEMCQRCGVKPASCWGIKDPRWASCWGCVDEVRAESAEKRLDDPCSGHIGRDGTPCIKCGQVIR